MAFANRIGEAQRGLATGSANYLAWLQNTAGANELLANAQFIEEMQRNPGLAMPQRPAVNAAPTPSTPQLPNTQVGIIPKQSWVPWDNLPPAPVLPPRTGTGVPSGSDGVGAGLMPWDQFRGIVSPTGPQQWYPENKDYYPNIDFTPGIGPENSPLLNAVRGAGNWFLNLPGDVANASANFIERPIANFAQWATTPEVEYNKIKPVDQMPLFGTTGQVPAPGANVPASGTTGAPPAAGLSDPASALPGPDGTSAGGAGSPSTLAPPAQSSTKQPGLTKAADPYSVPREVRNEALQLSAEEHDYFEQMLTQQRQQIQTDANNQINYLADQQQRRIQPLVQRAEAARRTGNIGLMMKFQDEANAILTTYEDGVQQINNAATVAYRQNEQDLWKQQAIRAEAEFMRGDPSRMLHIFDAYGYPTRLQDAGGGKFHVITVTGDGKGKRLPGGPYTSEGVSDLFHSMMSDEFRQQQAASQAEQAKTLQDFMFELQKIDYQGAVDMQKAVATELAKGKKYLQQSADDGSIVYTPEDGSGDIIVYNPDPPEIPNSGGLHEPKISKHPIGQ